MNVLKKRPAEAQHGSLPDLEVVVQRPERDEGGAERGQRAEPPELGDAPESQRQGCRANQDPAEGLR